MFKLNYLATHTSQPVIGEEAITTVSLAFSGVLVRHVKGGIINLDENSLRFEAHSLLSSLPFKSEAEIREDEKKKDERLHEIRLQYIAEREKEMFERGKSEGRKEMLEEVKHIWEETKLDFVPDSDANVVYQFGKWLSEQKKTMEGKT